MAQEVSIVNGEFVTKDSNPLVQQRNADYEEFRQSRHYNSLQTEQGQERAFEAYRKAKLTSHQPSEGRMTTIQEGRTEAGVWKPAHQLTDKDIINVAGGETSVAAAFQAGLIVRNADGSISAVSEPAWMKRERVEQMEREIEMREAQEAMEDLSDQDAEDLVSHVAQNVPAGDVMQVIDEVASGQDISEGSINTIASHLGMEPEEAMAQYETIRQGFYQQASKAVTGDNPSLDAEEIFQWGWQNMPGEMNKAIRSQLMERSTEAFASIKQAYTLNLDKTDPDRLMDGLRKSGFSNVERDKLTGKITFKDPMHGAMEWRAAVYAKLISL